MPAAAAGSVCPGVEGRAGPPAGHPPAQVRPVRGGGGGVRAVQGGQTPAAARTNPRRV